MAGPEQSHIEGIVDPETFRYFLVGWTSNILTRTRERRDPQVGRGEILEEFDEAFGVNFGRTWFRQARILIEGCPWNEIPKSLQEMIALQYDELEAVMGIKKLVDVQVNGTHSISFYLKSPFIVDSLSKHVTTPIRHLTLSLGFGAPRSEWTIMKPFPDDTDQDISEKIGDRLRIGISDDEWKKFLRRLRSGFQYSPTSVQQLRDVATLLEKFKGKARPWLI